MKTLDKLRGILTEVLPVGMDFSIEYYRKGQTTNLQTIEDTGYYLSVWVKGHSPKPGSWQFKDYVDGEFIGPSFDAARMWIYQNLDKNE